MQSVINYEFKVWERERAVLGKFLAGLILNSIIKPSKNIKQPNWYNSMPKERQ